MNVQTVSDAKLRIRDIVARWPGSTHDQTIFNGSRIKTQMENGKFGNNYLLGDSGYAGCPYLMTPLREVNNAAQNLYNEAQIRTRNTVERQYGVWKRRFPILSIGMRCCVDRIMVIIMATAILHNIAIDMNEPLPEDYESDSENEDIEDVPDDNPVNRQLLIEEYFQNL